MRILLRFSTYGYISYHSFAKRMKELIPDITFGIAGGAPIAMEFLNRQKDIDYWTDENEYPVFSEDDINYEELRKFENNSPYKSLWRIIATDRALGRAFLFGIVGYEQKESNNRLFILKSFNEKLKYYRNLFESFKPDIFIPAMAMGDIGVTIIKQLCDEYGVLYSVPDSVRVQNYCSFTDTEKILFPNIDTIYKKILNGEKSVDLAPAEKLFEELTSDLDYSTSYFDANNERMNQVKQWSFIKKCKIFLLQIPFVVFRIIFNGFLKKNDLLSICFSLRNYILMQMQRNKLSSKKFGSFLSSKQKYIYYPLHINPEYSTLIQGTMFGNQLTLIEALAKSIPNDWVVYVKEHPAMVKEVVRARSFYKRIEELPNVVMAPVYADSYRIINNAEMVAIINGTSGWEAILRGKPVINMSDYMFDVLELSKKCTDIEKLSVDIHDELNRIRQISFQERKKRIICFLASILEHGFWISHPNPFFYIEPGTENELEVCGRELADGFVKYLNYLTENKEYNFKSICHDLHD